MVAIGQNAVSLFFLMLGLGFDLESKAIRLAVNNMEWELQFIDTTIHFYLRSGESVLKQFSFLETHLPMASRKGDEYRQVMYPKLNKQKTVAIAKLNEFLFKICVCFV